MNTLLILSQAVQLSTNASEGSSVNWVVVLIAVVIGLPVVLIGIIYLIMPVFRGISAVFSRLWRFIGYTLSDLIRAAGIVLTAAVLSVMAIFNTAIGRWSAAQHYARAIQAELTALSACFYRLFIGNPARLVFLEGLVEGIESRVPQAMALAPGATGNPQAGPAPIAAARSPRPPLAEPADHAGDEDLEGPNAPTLPVSVPHRKPHRAVGFDGYDIVGTLAGGGSGSRLYIARPDDLKLATFARNGAGPVGDVVIKSFSIAEGSSLPNIIRESRALEAAKKLNLILDQELSSDRFYYVMRYVPGDSLSLVTQRLHAASPAAGLDQPSLTRAVSYVADLVATLDQYHRAGLWHKDIKPDNIIVTPEPPKGDGRAHLVDFGLLTPLRSTMTLTTHGTEYFRDPEMVRMALRGVKVHQVDGAKFDLYGCGAVLYAVIENSFPDSGGLSQIRKACPEPLKWIVRRAMTDYDKRYPSSAAMLADLAVVLSALRSGAINTLRVADLPSMRAGMDTAAPDAGAAAAAGFAAAAPFAAAPAGAGVAPPEPAFGTFARAAGTAARIAANQFRKSAAEQVKSARTRAKEARERARAARINLRGVNVWRYDTKPAPGLIAAIIIAIVVFGGVFGSRKSTTSTPPAPTPVPVTVSIAGLDDVEATVPPTAQRRSTSTRKPATPVIPPPTVDNVPVLLLREPPALMEPRASQSAKLIASLKDRGFVLLGAPDDTTSAAYADELAAKLRTAVGVQPIGSPEARATAEKWLADLKPAEGQPMPQAIVWMTRHQTDEKLLWTWVVPSATCSKDTLKIAASALSP